MTEPRPLMIIFARACLIFGNVFIGKPHKFLQFACLFRVCFNSDLGCSYPINDACMVNLPKDRNDPNGIPRIFGNPLANVARFGIKSPPTFPFELFQWYLVKFGRGLG